jgi:CubicO group peptidase (beta-lactamase class C family)
MANKSLGLRLPVFPLTPGVTAIAFLFAFTAISLVCASASAANARPTALKLGEVDSIINRAVADGNIPGAVLLVGHDGAVIYRKAYGQRSLEPQRAPMTVDTIFDLASLTKVIATTTAVMQLVELGKVRLNDTVAKYLPEFAQNGKEDITLRQLFTHYSGLAPDLDLKMPWEGKDTAYKMAFEQTPAEPPGSHFTYSDISFCWARWSKKFRVKRLTTTRRSMFSGR